MIATVNTVAFLGLEARPVEVQCQLVAGLPNFIVVGLADKADAHLVVRALLRMEPDEPVGEEDLVDAFGEIANVVGGNLKSLLPEHAELTLPTVAAEPPVLAQEMMVAQTPLAWRGACFVISLWMLV